MKFNLVSKVHYLSEEGDNKLQSNLIDSLEKEYTSVNISNIQLPEQFTEKIINDFNERNFVNENINDIIHLIDFLDINFEDARKFIIKNLPKNTPLNIDDIHQTNYKFPKFIFENNSHFKDFVNEIITENAIEWLEFVLNLETEVINLTSEFMNNAIKCGSLECLKLLYNKGCTFDSNLCDLAAECGNLNILKYVHTYCCHLTTYTCAYAAKNGNLECLKYAYINNRVYITYEDVHTCDMAVKGGHIECLKFAHKHKFPWDTETAKVCVNNGKLVCLEYLHKNGCPLPDDICKIAKEDCLKYLVYHKCPGWEEI